MKNTIFLVFSGLVISVLLYPTKSISNGNGSPGGKTGSPNDIATDPGFSSCTACHYAGSGSGGTITTNIPASGYIPNQTYTITANINQSGINKFGFEITSEEANFGSAKTGSFLVTNSSETQATNNSAAVTHKAGGTFGNNTKSWSMDWQAPNSGTGDITFYAAFMAANGDGSNSGDTYHQTTLTINEGTVNNTHSLADNNKTIISFNSINKTIVTDQISTITIYNLGGRIITKKDNTKSVSLKNIKSGIYVINQINKEGQQTNKTIFIN